MTTLKKRIKNAITPRAVAKGYGDNPDAIVTRDYGDVYCTPKELDKMIRMRSCSKVALCIRGHGHTQETIDNEQYYPESYYSAVMVDKKYAKQVAADWSDWDEKVNEQKLVKVTLYSWSEEGTFALYMGGK